LADYVSLSALPGIHILTVAREQDVDGRDEPGHNG